MAEPGYTKQGGVCIRAPDVKDLDSGERGGRAARRARHIRRSLTGPAKSIRAAVCNTNEYVFQIRIHTVGTQVSPYFCWE